MQITTKSGLTLQLPSLEEDAQISAAMDEESPELEAENISVSVAGI